MAPIKPIRDVDEGYVPINYQPTRGIQNLNNYPRWNYPSEPVYLYGSAATSDEKQDYLRGITIGSLIIFMIFLVWSLVLLFFKCGGRRKFGCASGSLPETPTRPASMGPADPASGVGSNGGNRSAGSDSGDGSQLPQCVQTWLEAEQQREKGELEEAESEIVKSEETASYADASYSTHNAGNVSPEIREAQAKKREDQSRRYLDSMRQFNRRVRLIRTIFLLAGLGILVATALFYAKGLMSLQKSLDSTQSTLEDGGSILQEAHNLTTSYLKVRKNVKEEVDNFAATTREFCPNSLSVFERLDLTANQTAPLQEQVSAIGESMSSLGDMLGDEFESLQDDLEQIMSDVDQASSSLDNAYPFLWAGAGAVGAQVIITLCLMAEVVAAARGRKMKHGCAKCMRNIIILPLFFLFTVLAWLFASLFLLAAISGSDFCVDPDKNIQTYLNAMVRDGRYSEVLVDYLAFFVKCVEARKPVDIPESADNVLTAIGVIHNFTEYLSSDDSLADDVCTPVGAGLIGSLSGLVHTELHGIKELFAGLMDLMSCSTFNPLYSSAAYDALCINGVDGLNWMFGTQLAVAICAMIMITLRSARRESKDLQSAASAAATAGAAGKGPSRTSSMNSRNMSLGAKPAPWEAAAVAAFVAADASSKPSSTANSQQTQPEDDEENIMEYGPCEEEEEEEEGNDESYYYGDEGDYGDETTPAGSTDGINEDGEAYDDWPNNNGDANIEHLETLTPAQVEAIENVGIEQAQSGRTYRRDELEARLSSISGLTDSQIDAVIEVELQTRG